MTFFKVLKGCLGVMLVGVALLVGIALIVLGLSVLL